MIYQEVTRVEPSPCFGYPKEREKRSFFIDKYASIGENIKWIFMPISSFAILKNTPET